MEWDMCPAPFQLPTELAWRGVFLGGSGHRRCVGGVHFEGARAIVPRMRLPRATSLRIPDVSAVRESRQFSMASAERAPQIPSSPQCLRGRHMSVVVCTIESVRPFTAVPLRQKKQLWQAPDTRHHVMISACPKGGRVRFSNVGMIGEARECWFDAFW